MEKKERETACGNCKKIAVCAIYPSVVDTVIKIKIGSKEPFSPYEIAKLCRFYEFDPESV